MLVKVLLLKNTSTECSFSSHGCRVDCNTALNVAVVVVTGHCRVNHDGTVSFSRLYNVLDRRFVFSPSANGVNFFIQPHRLDCWIRLIVWIEESYHTDIFSLRESVWSNASFHKTTFACSLYGRPNAETQSGRGCRLLQYLHWPINSKTVFGFGWNFKVFHDRSPDMISTLMLYITEIF